MIPKIIHLCWLSGDPFPDDIKLCLKSWKQIIPDYEIYFWGKLPPNSIDTVFNGMKVKEMTFDINSTVWTKQAFEYKKYAFAADYIRLYAVYKYGGIYLDSDIVIYKRFDDLLNLPYFIGQQYEGSLEAAVFGAESGTVWIKKVFDRYTDRHFLKNDGALDLLSAPRVFYQVLTPIYKFHRLTKKIDYFYEDNRIYVFDKDFFNSRNSQGVSRTSKSFCAHNYASSWIRKNDSASKKILKNLTPKVLRRLFCFFYHNTIKKKKLLEVVPEFENYSSTILW